MITNNPTGSSDEPSQGDCPQCGVAPSEDVIAFKSQLQEGQLLLIVEDDLTDMALYKRMFASDAKLQALFQKVVYATNFQEARACIDLQKPDCCLMDFQLPEGRATDFIQTLQGEGIRFPIVISTGVGNERLVVELMQLGVQDYLTKDDLSAPVLARTLRNAMTTFQLESELYHRAHYDGLTGLANRVTFIARLREAVEQARRYQRRLCLLYIDIDHFKQVNDDYGHEWGDVLLSQVAARLRACIRQTDVAARLGGDEFVLLLLEADVNQGLSVAEKLFAAMAEPISHGVEDLCVSLSIGVADFPASASDEKELVAHADVALYKAKARGRAQFATFSQEDVIAWRERKLLKKILPEAIAKGDLSLRYVPLFDVRTQQCVLVVASVHWETPSLCMVNDQVFALATENSVQHALVVWLLKTCVEQLTLWRQAQPQLGAVLPLRAEFLQQRGVRAAIEQILARDPSLRDGLCVPMGFAHDDNVSESWGLRPLLPMSVMTKQSGPKNGLTLLDLLADLDCQFCQISDEVLVRTLDNGQQNKGKDALLKGITAMGASLGVTILSTQWAACLGYQSVTGLGVTGSGVDRAGAARSDTARPSMVGSSAARPTAPCEDWMAFLTKAIDLIAVLPKETKVGHAAAINPEHVPD